MTERSRGAQSTVLRSYPSSDDRPWLYVLLETLAELAGLRALDELAETTARRARDMFGASVRAVILLPEDDALRIVRGADAASMPERISPSPVNLDEYVPGRISEITDLDAYVEAHPLLEQAHRGGFAHALSAAFGPHAAQPGFLVLLHQRETTYSDDELTLLAIFATAVGLKLGALRHERSD